MIFDAVFLGATLGAYCHADAWNPPESITPLSRSSRTHVIQEERGRGVGVGVDKAAGVDAVPQRPVPGDYDGFARILWVEKSGT